jgi:hypothetical protein
VLPDKYSEIEDIKAFIESPDNRVRTLFAELVVVEAMIYRFYVPTRTYLNSTPERLSAMEEALLESFNSPHFTFNGEFVLYSASKKRQGFNPAFYAVQRYSPDTKRQRSGF